ncbi:MAG: hypothetical protein ACYS1A_15960 [Planctomycetota bacterium]
MSRASGWHEPDIGQLVHKILEKAKPPDNPSERFTYAEELRRELSSWLLDSDGSFAGRGMATIPDNRLPCISLLEIAIKIDQAWQREINKT